MLDLIKKLKKMSVIQLCSKLLAMVKDDGIIYKENNDEISYICDSIKSIKIHSVEELEAFLDLQSALHAIKGTKARMAEKQTVRKIARLSSGYLHLYNDRPDLESAEIEQLENNMIERLLLYAAEILESKEGKSRREINRLCAVIQLLAHIHLFRGVKGIEEVFWKYIDHKEKDIRSAAFMGLEAHFENGGAISDDQVEMLKQVIANTPDYIFMVTSCKFLVDVGKMDKLEAIRNLNAWRER